MDSEILKQISYVRHFAKGRVIVKEGERPGEKSGGNSDELFVILKGSVILYKNYLQPHEVRIAALGAGDFFGESALFLDKSQAATAIAADDSILMGVSRNKISDFFAEQPGATFMMIKALCSRTDELSRALSFTRKEPTVMAEKNEIPKDASQETSKEIPKEIPKNIPKDIPKDIPKEIPTGFFPEGHKVYSLNYIPENPSLVYEKKAVCPLCDNEFGTPVVKASSRSEGVDRDFRPRHRGVDTLYYQVVTCPRCWHSALHGSFEHAAAKKADAFHKRVEEIKPQIKPLFDKASVKGAVDANRLFASFYLALESASLCYFQPEMLTARIRLRIHWLYNDCGDADMGLKSVKSAQKAYLDAYNNADIQAEQLQQIQVIIGELSLKAGDPETAKRFFQMSILCRPSALPLRTQAEIRLEELKKAAH